MTNNVTAQEGLGDAVMISVNYDEGKAISAAIDDADFDHNWVDVDTDEIPVGGNGVATNEVFELHLNRVVYSRDLPGELEGRELAFADPLTALQYAKELPDRQQKYPLCILFLDAKRQLCYLFLGGDAGGRYLTIRAAFSDGSWNEYNRFLVVRKAE